MPSMVRPPTLSSWSESARFGLIVVIPKPVSRLKVFGSESCTRAPTRRSPCCNLTGTSTRAENPLLCPETCVKAAKHDRKATGTQKGFLELVLRRTGNDRKQSIFQKLALRSGKRQDESALSAP